MNKSVTILILALISFVANATRAQEIQVEQEVLDINTVKKQYKTRQKKFSEEKRKLKSLLKKPENFSDTLTSEKILLTFSEINAMAKEKMPGTDVEKLKPEIQEAIPEKHKKKLDRMQQKWASSKADWQHYARSDSALKNYWQELKSDSVLMAKAETKLMNHLKEELGGSFIPDETPEDQLKATFDQLDAFTDETAAYQQLTEGAFEYSSDDLKSITKEKVTGPLLGKDDIVEEAHNTMYELKKKYSFVQNSNDLSTAVKTNSLKGKPLSQRVRLGGTFLFRAVNRGLKVDLSPTLGYKLNADLILGIGGTYRASFGKTNAETEPVRVHGVKAFGQQKLFKSVFAYIEWEYLTMQTHMIETAGTITQTTHGLLAGLAREFRFLKNITATAYWLYHFNHNNNPAYKSPWQFRLGFNLNTLKL